MKPGRTRPVRWSHSGRRGGLEFHGMKIAHTTQLYQLTQLYLPTDLYLLAAEGKMVVYIDPSMSPEQLAKLLVRPAKGGEI
jgi:hypothetical protein